MRRVSRQNRLAVIGFVILSIVVLTVHFRESREGFLHQSQGVALTLIAPLQMAATTVFTPFSNLWFYVRDLGGLRNRNQQLRKENLRLREAGVELATVQGENERLRRLLDYKKRTKYKLVTAQVIGREAVGYQAAIVINRGTADGARLNMPVVVGEGLVGQVVQTSIHASVVQLIIDRRSGVAAILQNARDTGVVEGQVDGTLRLNFISKRAKVAAGDIVLTSGLGGVFPKGIIVGTASEVRQHPYSLYKNIKVESPVAFEHLEELFIVVDPLPRAIFPTEGK